MTRYKIPSDRLVKIFPETSPLKLKFRDVFDAKEFYIAMKEWLLENGWKDTQGTSEFWEANYDEKVTQDGAKEIWVWWRLSKDAPVAKYLKYHLDIDYHFLHILPAEIIQDGKKLKVNKGEVEMFIKAYIEEKYKEDFEKNSFLKSIKGIFSKRIYHKEVDIRKKELYQEMYALQNFVKQWFKLKRYLPYEEARNFFPSKAWPSHIKEE
ncbi:hypothetical protein COV20_01900 [Candidatus Woesearchaeota archaeon CG10_big_fil_rev_8_21_14_0_10_45_16]|nr:MAG: hypothetical protein COV20_01900 [Candidatus Woesearchaeota archaeon CG10_big_fil_rev_8_21_14_0_10_45_16]